MESAVFEVLKFPHISSVGKIGQITAFFGDILTSISLKWSYLTVDIDGVQYYHDVLRRSTMQTWTWRGVSIAIATAVVMMGGCESTLNPHARELLQSAEISLDDGQYLRTVEYADQFLLSNSRSIDASKAYYLRGRAKAMTHNSEGARADLAKAIDLARDKDILAASQSALGDLAYWSGDMALAENMYRKGLGGLESHTRKAGHANYRLGCVLQRQGRWAEADVAFNKVIYHLPGSDLASRASRRVHRDTWTIQVGAFSEKKVADQNAQDLTKQSLPAVAKPESIDHSLLFVVQVGRYPTYEQASADLDKVRKLQQEAFVTVTR